MKVLFVFTSCKKSGPIQQMLNLVKYLFEKGFAISLITIYKESNKNDSVLEEFKKYVNHQQIITSKFNILFLKNKKIKKIINDINPDVIHTLGVFPDYLIEKLGFKNHTFTCRNYVYEDYLDEYGFLMGNILAKIHIKAIKNCKYVCCCSETLSNIYLKELNIRIPFIRNGVDTSFYSAPLFGEKERVKKEMGFNNTKKICLYSGKFNGRKNQQFLLQNIINCKHFDDIILLLLGDGPSFKQLKSQYKCFENIMFLGQVFDVRKYLIASDFYISTSKSEGMPNGVLEAMSMGLPVFLSNIPQHAEILKISSKIGESYPCESSAGFINGFDNFYEKLNREMGKEASRVANLYFSYSKTGDEYIKLYDNISKGVVHGV